MSCRCCAGRRLPYRRTRTRTRYRPSSSTRATCGLTEYNPVQGATRNPERPRDREALPWEVEVLKTAATPLLALMIRFNEITGFRSGEIRSIEHKHLEAGGIRFKRSKGGDREFWEWTSGL